MHLPTFLATLALTASTALAGVSNVHNGCDFDVFITSVGISQSDTKKISPGIYWNEEQIIESGGIGTAVKITRTDDGLWANKPVLHFSYSYDIGQTIYYDLSTHNGFDFWGKKLRIHGAEGKDVTEIVWNGEPKPNHTLVYVGDTDLTLELCE